SEGRDASQNKYAPPNRPPPIASFDPKTGTRGAPGLPRWMRDLMQTSDARLIVDSKTTLSLEVPPGAEESPLGSKDGLGGFALISSKGDAIAHRIDGVTGAGLVNGLSVAG